jgi:hypothetical protein
VRHKACGLRNPMKANMFLDCVENTLSHTRTSPF